MTFHPTAHPNQLTHTTTYLLTHQWIPSSPSSPSSPSPRPHPSLPPPSMPMVAPPGVAPLLRGRSSSTSASYPSSTASVYVACLLTVAYRPCSITPHTRIYHFVFLVTGGRPPLHFTGHVGHSIISASLVLPLRRMYQIVYHYDSHYHSSIIGGKDLILFMMVARARIPFELPTAVESTFSPGLA